MSTPFLLEFTHRLIPRLVELRLIEVSPDEVETVQVYVANYLATVARGGSLISSMEKALLDCAEVDEVYFNLDSLKAAVEDLQP